VLSAKIIVEELKKQGITHIVGLPDNGSRVLFELLWETAEIEVIQVSREGEAFAIASGIYLGGKNPALLIQNTGFLESGDAFRGTVHNMRIPILLLIGYRGYKTLIPGAPRVDSVATFLEPTLKAWDIPYSILTDDKEAEQISIGVKKAGDTSMPAAVLLAEETT
jgi:sulfopyruvate decarboxylase subunit alpha